MFGGYARWHADLPAPSDAIPARSLLSSLDHAARAAGAAARPGPVHLNCQFREPLAPVAGSWSRACLQVGGMGEGLVARLQVVIVCTPLSIKAGVQPQRAGGRCELQKRSAGGCQLPSLPILKDSVKREGL